MIAVIEQSTGVGLVTRRLGALIRNPSNPVCPNNLPSTGAMLRNVPCRLIALMRCGA